MAEIKETLELLEGVKVISVVGAEIFADGKVNLADLSKLTDLVTNFSVLKDAVSGIKEIGTEIKDLDSAEITELASKALEIVNTIKEALKEKE